MNFKKLFAGIALGAMVFGAGAPAFATVVSNDDTKDAVFYANYNGTWAAAPHGMDDANIGSATLNSDGSVTLTLVDAVYTMGGAQMAGYVENIYEEEYDEQGNLLLEMPLAEDTNEDGKVDTVTLLPGEDNKVAINMIVTAGNMGHAQAQVVYLNLDDVTAE